MENPILVRKQQLGVAAQSLPAPNGELGKRVVVRAPRMQFGHPGLPAIGQEHEEVEFELDEIRALGKPSTRVWRFDGKLFVDHWVEPDDRQKLRLFIELACNAEAVTIHRREGELVVVSAYFRKGLHRDGQAPFAALRSD